LRRGLILLTLAVLILYVVGQGALPVDSGETMIYREGISSMPKGLDPHYSGGYIEDRILALVFQTLVEINHMGQVKEGGAKGWSICPKGITYTFFLRENLKFHKESNGQQGKNGGRTATAYDWEYTFNRLADPTVNSPYAYLLEYVKGYHSYRDGKATGLIGVKAVDKFILKITLSKPFSPFLRILAMPQMGVISKEDINYFEENIKFHPIGSGPYYVESYNEGSILLSKNNSYWERNRGKRTPFIDNLEFKMVSKEEGERLYSEGKLQGIPFHWKGEGNVLTAPGKKIFLLGFSMGKHPFGTNSDLRNIIASIIDNGEFSSINKKPVYLLSSFWWDDITNYQKDIKKTKTKVLERDPKGITIQYTYPTDEVHYQISELLRKQLSLGEVHLKTRYIDWRNFIDHVERKELDFFPIIWEMPYYDPDGVFYYLLSSNMSGKTNWAYYENPIVYNLIQEGRSEVDWGKRRDIYKTIESIILEEIPVLPLFTDISGLRVKDNIENIVLLNGYGGLVIYKYAYIKE
jgi:ABC-type transport system substrate-binding protein